MPLNLTAPSEVKSLLAELNFHPSKVLGQNFLIDANILRILLNTADLHPDDAVIEIGPGLGVLTECLTRRAGKVVAIEKDKRLAAYLKAHAQQRPNLELIEADVLKMDLDKHLAAGFNKVVANLPFYLTSRLLIHLAETSHRPEQMTVTIQDEVADRLIAAPGTKNYGLLSVLMRLRYEIDVRKKVSPSCFFPPPDVKSAIVNMVLRQAVPKMQNYDHLKGLLKRCFTKRRKQMGGILRKDVAMGDAVWRHVKFDPQSRPETLTPEQWVKLSNALLDHGGQPDDTPDGRCRQNSCLCDFR